MALGEACEQAIWIRSLLQVFDVDTTSPTLLYEDNQGTTDWGSERVRHAKHVSIKYNFVKDNVDSKVVKIVYCPTEEMVADILTKPLLRVRFENLRSKLSVHQGPQD